MPPQGPNIGLGVFVFRSPSDLRFVFGRRKGSLGSGKPPYPSLFLHHFTFSSTPTSSDWIAGTYSLTGGHLELGETFEAGAKREVLEETGLEIEGVRFFTAVENFFEGEGRHYVTLFMVGFVSSRHAEGGGGEVEAKNLEPEKCEGWEWWTVRELRERYHSRPEDLFLPMRNFFEQRPEMAEKLERGEF